MPLVSLSTIKEKTSQEALKARDKAWKNYIEPIARERDELLRIIDNRGCDCAEEGIDKLGILSRELN